MIEYKQMYLHVPSEGIIGDCWRTCIACILDIHPNTLPHYYKQYWKDGDNIAPLVQARTNEELRDYGVVYTEYPLQCTLEELRTYLTHYYKDMYVIVGCNSKNGGHSVIIKNKDYIWDPAIDNSGCEGPMEDGYFWIGLLVSTQQVAAI